MFILQYYTCLEKAVVDNWTGKIELDLGSCLDYLIPVFNKGVKARLSVHQIITYQ